MKGKTKRTSRILMAVLIAAPLLGATAYALTPASRMAVQTSESTRLAGLGAGLLALARFARARAR